jgi:hypothetical protein
MKGNNSRQLMLRMVCASSAMKRSPFPAGKTAILRGFNLETEDERRNTSRRVYWAGIIVAGASGFSNSDCLQKN